MNFRHVFIGFCLFASICSASEIGIKEHLGSTLNLELNFTDEDGQVRPLGRFFKAGRPALMVIVYYSCPSLCNAQLNALFRRLKDSKWRPGTEFDVIVVSMDSRESSELAKEKKANYLKSFGLADSGVHFLVGDQKGITELANQLGFYFKWMPKEQEFAHVAAAYVLNDSGQIIRYVYGIDPDPATLKFGLLEAVAGKMGTFSDRVLFHFVRFDPNTNKYAVRAWNLLGIGAIFVMFLFLTSWLLIVARERKAN